MAVPKSKTSKARKRKRRSHQALTPFQMTYDALAGEYHRSHHVSPSGYYKGKKVIKGKSDGNDV